MKQTLQLRLGQQLTMTPQLQQAIRLLQLSAIDLREEVQSIIESNPLLDLQEENSETLNNKDPDNVIVDLTANTQSNSNSESDTASPDYDPIPAWSENYTNVSAKVSRKKDSVDDFVYQGETETSLQDHLLWQVNLSPFTEQDRAIATTIIDSINDEGYLQCTLSDILESLAQEEPPSLEEIEVVLHRIQHFDPLGVGARSLDECLLVQLGCLDEKDPIVISAKHLVQNYLDLLGKQEFNRIKSKLRLNDEQLQEVINLIRSLNPHPGNEIDIQKPEYIVPDVAVKKHNGKFVVELNKELMPKVSINRDYASLIKRADSSSDNQFLRNNLQEAKWFLKSLDNRNETLLKVANCIIERQHDFLEHGEEAMKPLTLHDIAESIDMHESTISRVTTRKYMHTPRGIYELKFFFSSHLNTTTGGECSSTAIRALIKKIVAAENPAKPLSDSKISQLLAEEGVKVARRTIAKYREALHIPPSNQRKRLK